MISRHPERFAVVPVDVHGATFQGSNATIEPLPVYAGNNALAVTVAYLNWSAIHLDIAIQAQGGVLSRLQIYQAVEALVCAPFAVPCTLQVSQRLQSAQDGSQILG